jgi:hypothetical protein
VKGFLITNPIIPFPTRYVIFNILSDDLLPFKVVIFPHNLQIVDYAIDVPGSLHDLTAFQHTQVARSPNQYFDQDEWLWADSTYGCHPWYVVPFKRPTEGSLSRAQKEFNYYLSKVCPFNYMIQVDNHGL